MNILFACDNNYAKYLLVTISSILKSREKCNESYNIQFYVLNSNIHQESINYIQYFLENRNAEIHFINMDDNDFDDFPIYIEYLSKTTYARLKTAEYLPSDIDKILYLDIDLLVSHSLLPLWNTILDDFPLAACEDPFIEYSSYKNMLGLNPQHKYFNAGVLLLNLKKWRELDIFNLAVSIIQGKELKYQDQDILNIIFENKVHYLDSRFNFTRNHREQIKKQGNKNPVITTMPIAIYHYVGSRKAWHAKCTLNRSSLFEKLYNELINPPLEWKIESVSIPQKITRWLKEVKDKLLYHIY